MGGGGWQGVFLTTQNSKCEILAKISFSGGGGRILDYSKLKVPSSGQIFIGGGGILDYSKLRVPSSGQIFIFWKKRVFLTK